MDVQDLTKVDLNLLISLQVLLDERNVSRAADRLHITQPAMSKTLSRLRQVFDDPLFTRSSHGMNPTPRAEELAAGLGAVLGDIAQLVSGPGFDPATFEGEVKLALSEYIGVTLLPVLTQSLQKQAPGLSLKIISRIENQLEQLALGNLDLALHFQRQDYSADYKVEHLGSSPPAILTREGHPLIEQISKYGGTVNLELLSAFPVIRLYISDWETLEINRYAGEYEPLLNSHRGSLEISHLLTALEVLRNTDYFMPAPAFILQNSEATRDIVALPLPPDVDQTIDYALVAHRRTANSPLHNWLWDQIRCTIADLRTPLSRKLRQRVAAGSADQTQP
jgi:DNA-binding transcriptional LysR family regulator